MVTTLKESYNDIAHERDTANTNERWNTNAMLLTTAAPLDRELPAFNTALDITAGLDENVLRSGMQGHVLAQRELIGAFKR